MSHAARNASEGRPAPPPPPGELHREVLETAGIGAWEWDVGSGAVTWSAALERMHGLPEGSFGGTFEASLLEIHPADREAVLAELSRLRTEGGPVALNYRIVRPDGQVRWLESRGRGLTDGTGRLTRLVGVCHDATDRRYSDVRERDLAIEQSARARLGEMLDHVTDSFAVIGHDWRMRYVNRAGAAQSGAEPEALIGVDLSGEFSDPTRSEFHAACIAAMRERVSSRIESHYPPTQRWYELHVYPVREGIASHSRDITEQKRAQELLARQAAHGAARAEVSEALSRPGSVGAMMQQCCESVVRHLGAAFARIWLVDPDDDVLLLKASAGQYTHLDGPHARVPIGRFKIGLIAQERLPHLTNDVQNDPRVGNPEWAKREGLVSFAGYPLLVDGRIQGVFAMFSRRPLPDDTLGTLGLMADAIAQGVERRRAEVRLADRAEELARSNADLERFAYVASHDLQEPLRMVASYTELLRRRYATKLDARADEYIGFAVDGANRMQQLINDLLTYSRLGTRASRVGAVSAAAALETARLNLAAAIEESGAQIVTERPLPEVAADPTQLVQVLQNLVGNALKFRGSATPVVRLAATREGPCWHFTVADNGIGIDPQYFDRIFVIFQRLHSRQDYPGTGIGLALCKRIIERHGGRIWLESSPAGSTFHFTLPAADAAHGPRS